HMSFTRDMKSVPPRDSGWVVVLKLSTKERPGPNSIECDPTHPLPRGGTDLISIQMLFLQPAKQAVDDRLSVRFVDCTGERNSHRAGLDAVLRVAAVCDA